MSQCTKPTEASEATDESVIGYNYMGVTECPGHLIESMIELGELSPGARGMSAEDALDQLSADCGVDREDEESFSEGDFPKRHRLSMGPFVCGH